MTTTVNEIINLNTLGMHIASRFVETIKEFRL